MIDGRAFTFLELCNVMNYHKTAQNLNMTQPAVTQHIKYLERLYGCKLFEYTNKKLYKTEKCLELEKFIRSMVSLNSSCTKALKAKEKTVLSIGATKTIGAYAVENTILQLAKNNNYEVNFIIDNTEKLLERLNRFELDLLLIEGYVDKNKYEHKSFMTKEMIGICSKAHAFANKKIPISTILNEKIVIREHGSGTRAVFENFLKQQGYSLQSITNKITVSSNSLIEKIIENNIAITFMYDIVLQKNKKLAGFKIGANKITHEFNYVFLKNTNAKQIINILENNKS